MVRRSLDEGETGGKKDQRKYYETVYDVMDPAGQISVPSIFDLPFAEELDASLAPTGLLPLVVLPLDFQTLADAVRIAVSKGAKMPAADLHSSSEVALVKHLFGSTDHHVMTQSVEASKLCVPRSLTAALHKRIAATQCIMSLNRHVELRNTLKNLAQAHPGGLQVLCDIDCRSYDETPIQLCIESQSSGISKVLQLHFRWAALVKVVGCTGATYFVIPKNSPRMPQVVQKNSAEPLSHNAQAFTPALEVANYHCVATVAAPSNTVTEAAVVRDPAPGDNHVQPDGRLFCT